MVATLPALLLAVALSGCATRHADLGFTRGVSAATIDEVSWRVDARFEARVDALASPSLVHDVALSNAAGLAKAAGGTHFTLTTIEEGVAPRPAHANGGRIATYRHPTLKAVVSLVRVKRGEALPAGAREVEEVILTLGAKLLG